MVQEQILTFFKAGHEMFNQPMVKLTLKQAALTGGKVDDVVSNMQKHIFESQGIDGTYGIGFLGKIRTTYGNDAEMIQQLMRFVEHEEMALDEAEMSLDDFLKKLQLREWAMQQYKTMQENMKNLSPQEQREVLLRQQTMMKEVGKESKDILSKAESMEESEKKAFVTEQVKKLQARFQITPVEGSQQNQSSPGPECQHCSHGGCSSTRTQSGETGLGSVMTPEEQSNFFKALYGPKR